MPGLDQTTTFGMVSILILIFLFLFPLSLGVYFQACPRRNDEDADVTLSTLRSKVGISG